MRNKKSGIRLKIKEESIKPFLLIYSDRSLGIAQFKGWEYQRHAELKTRCVEAKIPFFPNIDQAAKAVRGLINYYNRQ